MKLIWGPTYFQAVLKYYEGFFHKIQPNNIWREKLNARWDTFFIVIFPFKMIRNWLLTWLDRKLTLRLTFENFLSFSAWFWDCFKFDCIYIQILPCCFSFNWNGHRGMLPRAAMRDKLVQSTGGTDYTRAAVEFQPLSPLFITIK